MKTFLYQKQIIMKKLLILTLLIVLPMIARSINSGTCGNNVYWKYNESKDTLTIYGNGPMENYTENYVTDWTYERKTLKITTVIIEEGVTHIGNYAFRSCGSIETVTIPQSLISIGNNAFLNCSSLASILIPSGVKSIADRAFAYCGLTTVTIQCNLTTMGDDIFEKNTKINFINGLGFSCLINIILLCKA